MTIVVHLFVIAIMKMETFRGKSSAELNRISIARDLALLPWRKNTFVCIARCTESGGFA
jgi:hypothetical protein